MSPRLLYLLTVATRRRERLGWHDYCDLELAERRVYGY